jgi:hypothetical protein
VAAHGGEHTIGVGFHLTGVLDQLAARRGGESALAEAFDEAHADAPFEFADLEADCNKFTSSARRAQPSPP